VSIIGSARATADKLGAAHRRQLLGAQPRHLRFGPSSIAVANGEVDILAREVDALVTRGHSEVDLRMALGEPAKPTDEARSQSSTTSRPSSPSLRLNHLSNTERAMLMGGACAKAYGWSPKETRSWPG
jgi:hypothetical protein